MSQLHSGRGSCSDLPEQEREDREPVGTDEQLRITAARRPPGCRRPRGPRPELGDEKVQHRGRPRPTASCPNTQHEDAVGHAVELGGLAKKGCGVEQSGGDCPGGRMCREIRGLPEGLGADRRQDFQHAIGGRGQQMARGHFQMSDCVGKVSP